MPKKLLVRLGDKVLAALVLLYVLYELVLGVQRWVGEPELTGKINRAIEQAEKAKPKPKIEPLEFTTYEELEEDLAWSKDLIKEPGRSLRYEEVEINTSVLQDEYTKLLDGHDHLYFEVTGGEGKKHCVFPGCSENVAPPPVYIGSPVELSLGGVGVMSIEFSWKAPREFKDAETQYCMVQRAKVLENQAAENFKWVDIVDDEGEIKKLYGVKEPSLKESVEASEFLLPDSVQVTGDGVQGKEEQLYRFLDYNLDPSSAYAYRVRAMGVSIRQDEDVIEGQWSEVLQAKTKVDQGVGFVKYLPGLRDSSGNLRLGSGGEPISQDKVYVRVRKLFEPPWSKQRYFVEYIHRNIIPGEEGKDAVGQIVPRYEVETEKGKRVYIDKRKENFLYESEDISESSVKAELEANRKNWRVYKIEFDFSTQWVALEVIEEVVEEMEKVTKYNDSGESRVVTSEGQIYRYFLVVKDRDSGEISRLELEREKDELSIRLRTD